MDCFLSADEAGALDSDLLNIGFTLAQLVEHAGLAAALAVCRTKREKCPVVVIAGNGNNGGDGLVCSRYLKEFGYSNVKVVMPGAKKKSDFMQQLMKTVDAYEIPIEYEIGEIPNNATVIDAMFGFGSRGIPRPPFDEIIKMINKANSFLVSIDVPSGWDVDKGPIFGDCSLRKPDLVVSLSAPKPCMRNAHCTHVVGGRFIPRILKEKYRLGIPYAGSELLLSYEDKTETANSEL